MKRAVVFLVLGPALAFFTTWLIYFAEGGSGSGYIAATVSILLFSFTWLVAMITWAIDGFLAHALPLPLRAPLTAIVGATVAVGLFLGLGGCFLPLWISTPFAIGGALCMGACSVLSHDYGLWKRFSHG